MDAHRGFGRAWLGDAWSDVHYTARTLRREPLFLLFVLLTLGLGIGANTSVFTVINTLVLNPLPVERASELAALAAADVSAKSRVPAILPLSYLNLQDYQRDTTVFRTLSGYTAPRVLTWQRAGQPERLFGELVTGNYFSTLELRPAIGRFFLPDEDTTPGGHPVAVMNYATWQARFGGAPDVVGQTLRLNNIVCTVIGVAPPRFIGVNAVFGPDVWIPASMAQALFPNEMAQAFSDRRQALFIGVGRVRPEVTRAQAQAGLAAIAAALAYQYPDVNEGHTVTIRPIRDVLFGTMANGSSVAFASIGLLLVVGLVLMIACSNLVNLLLARATTRRHEVAVRMALGATRGRLLRQWLTESVVLGLLSGIVGVVIGNLGVRVLWSFRPPEVATNLVTPKLDLTVLAYTFVTSVAAGVIFGVVPALRASRIELSEKLKEEGRSVGRQRRRVRLANVLLVAQVACSFVLLLTAILFVRSMQRAYDVDPGFQTKNLVLVLTNPGQAGYTKPQTRAFYQAVRDRVATLPGVASVSWASNLPLWGRLVGGLRVEGHEVSSQAETITTVINTVDVKYFETTGIPMIAGRPFTEIDLPDSTPVAVVNERAARDFWPGQRALGRRIQLPTEKTARQIVGVARTANYSTLAEPPQYCVYLPLEQHYTDAMTLYVRSHGEPEQIVRSVQREMRAVAPEISVTDVRTGTTILDAALFQARMGVALLGVLGLLALGLASVGLYGIMAYSVSRRTREIGMRMALGAARNNVLRLILLEGMSMVGLGVLIGFGMSLLTGRLLTRMLFGIGGSDPISVLGAASILVLAAVAACYWPARRASGLDPLVALRQG